MQEKLQAAEARAARAEDEQAASLELQSRISTLEMQLQAWEASSNDLGIDRPEELFAKLQELRNECLTAANSRGDTEVELRKSQGSLLWQPSRVLVKGQWAGSYSISLLHCNDPGLLLQRN